MKKPAYLIACSLVITGFFMVPTANAAVSTIHSDYYVLTADANARKWFISWDPTGMTNDGYTYSYTIGSNNFTDQTTGLINRASTTPYLWTTSAIPQVTWDRADWIKITVFDSATSTYVPFLPTRPLQVGLKCYMDHCVSEVTTPAAIGITSTDLNNFGDTYMLPIYKVLGGIAAVAVLYSAYWFALRPWVRRFK